MAQRPLDDQIDRPRRERLILRGFPTLDRPKDRPLLDVGPCQPPNTHPHHFAAPAPPDANAKRSIARSRVSARQSIAQVAISRSKPSRATARLLLRCRGRGEAQTANRSAERRLGAANGPSIPFQRCSVLQPASRRLTVLGHGGHSNAAIPPPAGFRRLSAGIPCRRSLTRFDGSQRSCAMHFNASASVAGHASACLRRRPPRSPK
jgi:hypothetical protein